MQLLCEAMSSDAIERSGWDLVRHGPFSRLFWAGFISSTGDWAALFAQISLADEIAGPTGILVVLAARLLPGLVGGAIGGILADRGSRRMVIVLTDVGRGLLVISLAWVGDLAPLFIISVGLEMLTLLGQPARAAVVPNLVHERNLLTANSLTLGSAYGTFPIGSGIAFVLGVLPTITVFGLLPATTGAKIFAFDSISFLLSALLVWTMFIPEKAIAPERRRASRFDLRAPIRDLVDGVRFVARHRTVRPIVLGISVALFGGGMLLVLGQGFTQEVLGADESGLFAMLTALGTGAGAGIIALTIYGDRLVRRDLAFGFSLSLAGLALVAISLVKTVPGAMGWAFVMGIGAGASYVMGFTHLHEEVEDDLRGRTFAALFSLMRIGLLVSMAIAAPAAEFLDGRFGSPFDNATRDVLFVGGTIVFMSGAGTLWSLRATFPRPRVTPESRWSMDAAGRAFGSVRGRVAAPLDEEEEHEEDKGG